MMGMNELGTFVGNKLTPWPTFFELDPVLEIILMKRIGTDLQKLMDGVFEFIKVYGPVRSKVILLNFTGPRMLATKCLEKLDLIHYDGGWQIVN